MSGSLSGFCVVVTADPTSTVVNILCDNRNSYTQNFSLISMTNQQQRLTCRLLPSYLHLSIVASVETSNDRPSQYSSSLLVSPSENFCTQFWPNKHERQDMTSHCLCILFAAKTLLENSSLRRHLATAASPFSLCTHRLSGIT